MNRVVRMAEAGARACALAVYAIAAALVLISAAAVATSLFTGSETTRAGAGFVIMGAALIAITAYASTRR